MHRKAASSVVGKKVRFIPKLKMRRKIFKVILREEMLV